MPRPRRRRSSPPPARLAVATVIAVGVTVAALYLAQDVLIPLALAIMMSFLLAPAANFLERHRFGRVPSVITVVGVATIFIMSLGYAVGQQVYTLAGSLEDYKEEIVDKARKIRGDGSPGLFSQLFKLSNDITEAATDDPTSKPATTTPATQDVASAAAAQISKDPSRALAGEAVGATSAAAPPPTTQPGHTPANPLFVRQSEAVSPLEILGRYVGLILSPLGTAGLVIVFVIFMLLEREKLRDRLIRLVSRGKYTVTTKAINDATGRITRYVIAQSIVNGTYGIVIALGLWIIGLTLGDQSFPSFILWGLLCAVLRFIPYVGPWMAAVFPIVLSLAVYDGFTVFFAVVAMFVIVELLSNNAMEPWLYGASTGLSTVAVLVAAVFWTWLWGPIGLFLATPMTVCIVVIGKYVTQFAFFDVLLGDQAALPPAVSFYQRLLAGDRAEALELARHGSKEHDRAHVPDEVFLPALLLTRRDRQSDELTADTETRIFEATGAIINETLSGPDATPADSEVTEPSPVRVIGVPAHHRAEEIALHALAKVIGPDVGGRVEVLSTHLLASEVQTRICRENPTVIVVAILPPGGVTQARFLCRRLRKAMPDAKILVAYFGKPREFDRLLERFRSAGATYVVTSIAQARGQVHQLLGLRTDDGTAPPIASTTVSP